MRKFVAASLAAVTAAGAVAASAAPAEARDRYYHRHRGGGGDAAAAAIIAGVAGLALGSALSSNGRTTTYYRSGGYGYDPRYDSYSGGYYGGYYAPPPRAYYAPRTCITRERVYDPYIGRRVTIQRRYAC